MPIKPPPKRCAWVPAGDELYARYHDDEWGVPLHDDRRLFEMLCLEGAQAGLSWRTILQRREGYRAVFAGFDPVKLARFRDHRLERILGDVRIIRNRLKVYATRGNARAFLALRDEGQSFDEYLWSFVGGEPIQNRRRSSRDIPAVTPEAEAMSKALKRRGFSFVGATICYAFMQAVGMVNDHLIGCDWHERVRAVSGEV
jgi:DNA-3-methyladenine glycosylase I